MTRRNSNGKRGWLSALFSSSSDSLLRRNSWSRQQAQEESRSQERIAAIQWAETERRLTQEHHKKKQAEERQRLAAITTNHESNQKLPKSQRERCRRANFRCSICTAENRDVPNSVREVNSGLCCAKGLDEYEGRYGLNGMPAEINLAASNANVSADSTTYRCYNPSMRSAPRRGINETMSERSSRERAIRDSMLDPALVSEFISLPGSHIQYLPDPSRPIPERTNKSVRMAATPADNPTGIDFRMWSHSKQTAHGRYPPPPPAPEENLPYPPLRSSKGIKFDDSRHVMARDMPHSTFSALDGDDDSRSSTTPSPTLSDDSRSSRDTHPREPSPVSSLKAARLEKRPDHKIRSIASRLDGPLNEAFKAWESVGEYGPRKQLPKPYSLGLRGELSQHRRR